MATERLSMRHTREILRQKWLLAVSPGGRPQLAGRARHDHQYSAPGRSGRPRLDADPGARRRCPAGAPLRAVTRLA